MTGIEFNIDSTNKKRIVIYRNNKIHKEFKYYSSMWLCIKDPENSKIILGDYNPNFYNYVEDITLKMSRDEKLSNII